MHYWHKRGSDLAMKLMRRFISVKHRSFYFMTGENTRSGIVETESMDALVSWRNPILRIDRSTDIKLGD